MPVIPNTQMQTSNGTVHMDLFSNLLANRIIMLDSEVNDQMASIIVSSLLYLDAQDPDRDITLYVNSPGGSVSAGFGIIDTMNTVHADVATVGFGMCASMGAVILSCGAKGKRYVLPHTEVMIHQPSGGTQGQASDMVIAAEHIKNTRETLTALLAEQSGQDINTVREMCDRDTYLSAEKAIELGFVDEMIKRR